MESGGWSRGVGHVRASGRRLGNCDFQVQVVDDTVTVCPLLEIDKTFLFIVVGHARLVVELFNWIQFRWLCAMLRPSLFWSCLQRYRRPVENDSTAIRSAMPTQEVRLSTFRFISAKHPTVVLARPVCGHTAIREPFRMTDEYLVEFIYLSGFFRTYAVQVSLGNTSVSLIIGKVYSA